MTILEDLLGVTEASVFVTLYKISGGMSTQLHKVMPAQQELEPVMNHWQKPAVVRHWAA